MCVSLVQAKSDQGLILHPALLPMRHVRQEVHSGCYILSTRRPDVWLDDQEEKVGKSSALGLFLSLLFQKTQLEDLLKLPTGLSNVILIP